MLFPWPDPERLPVIVKLVYHETVDPCSGTYWYKTAPGELMDEPRNCLVRKVRPPRILRIETEVEENQVTVVGSWLSTQEVYRQAYPSNQVLTFSRLKHEARAHLIAAGILTTQETVTLQVRGENEVASLRRRVYKVRRNR